MSVTAARDEWNTSEQRGRYGALMDWLKASGHDGREYVPFQQHVIHGCVEPLLTSLDERMALMDALTAKDRRSLSAAWVRAVCTLACLYASFGDEELFEHVPAGGTSWWQYVTATPAVFASGDVLQVEAARRTWLVLLEELRNIVAQARATYPDLGEVAYPSGSMQPVVFFLTLLPDCSPRVRESWLWREALRRKGRQQGRLFAHVLSRQALLMRAAFAELHLFDTYYASFSPFFMQRRRAFDPVLYDLFAAWLGFQLKLLQPRVILLFEQDERLFYALPEKFQYRVKILPNLRVLIDDLDAAHAADEERVRKIADHLFWMLPEEVWREGESL